MARALRDSVTHYIDHIQDVPWIESLVAEHGVAAILEACAGVLAGQRTDEVNEVTTLVRDLGIHGIVSRELSTTVRELLPASVLPALRPLLRAPVLQVRMAAIYTFGKLGFSSEIEALGEAVPIYLDRDPLCLVRALGELGWLGDPDFQARMDRAVAHEHYLVRWSALGLLATWMYRADPELGWKTRWLETLSADLAPLVAAEARHQLAELELQAAGEAASWHPKAEWRGRRRELEEARPALTFSMLEIRFLNELHRRSQADYTLEELAAFVETLVSRP